MYFMLLWWFWQCNVSFSICIYIALFDMRKFLIILRSHNKFSVDIIAGSLKILVKYGCCWLSLVGGANGWHGWSSLIGSKHSIEHIIIAVCDCLEDDLGSRCRVVHLPCVESFFYLNILVLEGLVVENFHHEVKGQDEQLYSCLHFLYSQKGEKGRRVRIAVSRA